MPDVLSGAAAEFLRRKYGGAFNDNTEVESVGTSAALVHGNDPERVSVVAVNLSANVIYVGFDEQVSSSRGIRLDANGGSTSYDIDRDFILPSRALYAVATGAGSNLFVLTMRRFTVA